MTDQNVQGSEDPGVRSNQDEHDRIGKVDPDRGRISRPIRDRLIAVALLAAGVLAFFTDFSDLINMPYPFPYLIGFTTLVVSLGYFAYSEKQDKLRVGAFVILGILLLVFSFWAGGVIHREPLILASSHFDRNSEGWGIEGDGTGPIYQETGGDQGGYIVGEESPGDRDWFWRAPSKFLDNQPDAYGGILIFSLKQDAVTNQFTATNDIILSDGNIQLEFDIENPEREWTEYAIPLHESAGWTTAEGQVATESEMRQVLSALEALEIRGEYHYMHDVGSLDRVILLRRP